MTTTVEEDIDTKLPVTVGINLAEAFLTHAGTGIRIAGTVHTQIAKICTVLGLQVSLSVGVKQDPKPRTGADIAEPLAITIHVGDAVCRFPDRLPTMAASLFTGSWPGPDERADSAAWSVGAEDPTRLADVVGLVCYEAIRTRPSVLMTREAIRSYAKRLATEMPELTSMADDEEWLREILSAVIDLGISVADVGHVGRVLREHEGAVACQAAEAIIGELAADTIGLKVPDEVGAEMGLGDSSNPDDLIAFAETALFEEAGIVMPRVVLEPCDELPPGTFAVRVNDLTSLATLLLPPDTALVNDTSERLSLGGEMAQPVLNPATDQPGSLVRSSRREVLEAEGLTTWNRAGHVILELATILRRQVAMVVSQDRMLAQLDVLEEYTPAVVRAARAQLPPAELTALLRRLAADRVSLRPLVSVLERIVDLPAQEAGMGRYALLTDPVHPAAGGSPSPRENAADSFIRTGLRYHLAQQFAPFPGTLVAYLVDPQLELMACAPGRSEEAENRILDAVAGELSALPPTARTPVILTNAATRGTLQQLLRSRYPLIVVLSHEDLPASVAVQPIARIAAETPGESR